MQHSDLKASQEQRYTLSSIYPWIRHVLSVLRSRVCSIQLKQLFAQRVIKKYLTKLQGCHFKQLANIGNVCEDFCVLITLVSIEQVYNGKVKLFNEIKPFCL